MKSQDSIPYYDFHSVRLAGLAKRHKTVAELSPFLEILEKKTRVMDLGCGSGADLGFMRDAGFQVEGIEGATNLALVARELNPEVTVLEKNLLFLNLEANAYGGVWINETLHHFDPELAQRIVGATFRGLRSGGILGVVVYEGAESFFDREGDLSGPSRFIHPYQEKSLCSMIEQTGFKVLRVGRVSKNEEAGKILPRLLILASKI